MRAGIMAILQSVACTLLFAACLVGLMALAALGGEAGPALLSLGVLVLFHCFFLRGNNIDWDGDGGD